MGLSVGRSSVPKDRTKEGGQIPVSKTLTQSLFLHMLVDDRQVHFDIGVSLFGSPGEASAR